MPASFRRLAGRAAALLLALSTLATGAHAQVPAANPAITLDAAGGATILVRQDDGKILAAGTFNKANATPRSSLARFNPDGTLDYAFAPSPDGAVTAVVVAGSAIYVAGAFTQIGGVARAGLARLNSADGNVVASFDPAPDGVVTALAADALGNVYAAGTFASIGGVAGRRLVKLDGDTGAAVGGWNPAFPDALTGIGALAVNGASLYVVGFVADDPAGDIGRAHRVGLASGVRDATWAPPHALVNNEGGSVVMAFDGAGNVFVAGPGGTSATAYGANPVQVQFVTLRKFLATSGAPDPAWTVPETGSPFLAIDGTSLYAKVDGVLFGGSGTPVWTIVKRDALTGAERAGWTSPDPGTGHMLAAAGTAEGVWVAGDFAYLDGQPAPGIGRLDAATGAVQSGINARVTTPGIGRTVAALPDGKYLIGGEFDFINGFQRSNLARLTADGQLDPTWIAQTDGPVWRVAVHGAHAYAGGFFTRAGGVQRNGVARFDAASGGVDALWNPNVQGSVRRFAFTGSDVFLGGPFSFVGGAPRLAIAKVSGIDGTLIPAFAPPFTPGCNWVIGTAGLAHADGFVYAGVAGSCLSGRRLARFSATSGALDDAWTTDANGTVRDILIAGSAMYIAGDFTEVGTVSKPRLARLETATGSADATWGDPPAAQDFVASLAIAGPHLYTGGFTVDPVTRLNTPVVDRHALATGLRDATWSPALTVAETASDITGVGIYGLAGSANGDRMFIAGNFSSVSGQAREGFAAIPTSGGAGGVSAKPNYQGIWWNAPAGSESGWGINFAHQGNTVFATWFTYGADGEPLWLIAVLNKTNSTVYAGEIATVTGPPFDSSPFDSAQVVESTVGAMTATFLNNDSAYLTYVVSGISQAKYLTRQTFASPVPACVWGALPNLALATNFQDIWWNYPAGSESGWGINFAHQGNTIFATWFTYGADGKPLWLIVVADKTAPNTYAGPVYTVTGPPFFSVPFDASAVVETVVGNATLTFADGNRATFAYTVSGTSQSKQITRQVFNAPGTVCF